MRTSSDIDRPRMIGVLIATALASLGVLMVAATIYLEQSDQSARFNGHAADIRYLDEVLTMSARQAAATGDMRWKHRYDDHVIALETALDAAEALAPVGFGQTLGKVSFANEALIERENRAFNWAEKGVLDAATRELNTVEYQSFKHLYTRGLEDAVKAANRGMIENRSRAQTAVFGAGAVAFLTLILVLWLAARRHDAERRRTTRSMNQLATQTMKLQHALSKEKDLAEMQNQFVALASHELRTPLAIIDGTARRLVKKADTLTPDELTERATQIRNTVTRMTMLVDRTLDSSKLTAGKLTLEPQPFDIGALLQTVVHRQRDIASKHQISLTVDNLPDDFYGDPKLLDNVFTNLLSNAVKYSDVNPVVEVRARVEDDTMVCCVKDFGIGIPNDELKKISERFFRARTATGIKGTGIGLNLARTLIEQHGGSLVVDSVEGEWTEFCVRLPIRETRKLTEDVAAPNPAAGATLDFRALAETA